MPNSEGCDSQSCHSDELGKGHGGVANSPDVSAGRSNETDHRGDHHPGETGQARDHNGDNSHDADVKQRNQHQQQHQQQQHRQQDHGGSRMSHPLSDEDPGVVDERKQKRMLSNRESARRSRLKKQHHLDEMRQQCPHNLNLSAQQPDCQRPHLLGWAPTPQCLDDRVEQIYHDEEVGAGGAAER
ncbi:unnamed protein product [Closterium sp. NIES-54]